MSWEKLLCTVQRLDASLSLQRWFAQVQSDCGPCTAFELALQGGRRAHTPGQAFLVGYQAALRALYPEAPAGIGALCATEGRNLRPAQIQTRFSQGRVTGQKGFLLAEHQAAWALVAAREEAEGESARLAMLLVELSATGVNISAGRALGMIPDVPHGQLQMTEVSAQRLPGDGWDDYAKPFRSLEDLYIHSAMLAWLAGLAREHGWPQALYLKLLGGLFSAEQLSQQGPQEPLMHVQLAALLAQFSALQAELEQALAQSQGPWAALWQRDKAILQLANNARAARLDKALQVIGEACRE